MTTWLVLSLLFVKHFLADFCWQTDKMLRDKGHLLRLGGLQHAGLHGALTYVILMHFLGIQACAILAVFDAFVHYHIDLLKVKISVKLTTQDRMYWIWFGLDQLAHAFTYLAIGLVTSILLVEYI